MSTWTEEREAELLAAVGAERPVSQSTAATVAEKLEVSARSVGAKLRKMGVEVDKAAARSKVFSDKEAQALADFVTSSSGKYTYAELAANFANGKFSAKQIQGKVLSLELTENVKKTPPKEVKKVYSEEEEATFVKMAQAGKFLEEIAKALNKPLNSVRGKALSLNRAIGLEIPKQRDHKAAEKDPITELGDKLASMTVAEIAEATGKTERGIKGIITRRNLECADYKAKKKKDAA